MSKKILVVSVACALALAWFPISAEAGKEKRSRAGNANREAAGNVNRNHGVGFCNSRISQSMGSLNQIALGKKQAKTAQRSQRA